MFRPSKATDTATDASSDDAESCMAALFLTDPSDDRQRIIDAKGSRANGTCEWIQGNTLYRDWFHSDSRLLWLSGGPGKGKTMISIFLTEEIEKFTKNSPDVKLLIYFCDNRDNKRNTATSIIRGLIFLAFADGKPFIYSHSSFIQNPESNAFQ